MKHIVFIGRWAPLHNGHKKLIKKVYEEKHLPVLVMVRNTDEEIPINKRVGIITNWLREEEIPGKVRIIPDIEGVYYGREVGYNIEQVDLDEETQKVSGTEIREMLKTGDLENVARNVLDKEEEKLIEERLRELGYIE